jgi:PTS system mannose-specific IID component
VVVARGRVPFSSAVLARLFVVQAGFSYERMLGVGVGFAAEPILRSLRESAGAGAYRAALARHSHYFNAHPYMASLAVGAAARAELDGVAPEKIDRLRAALAGPLGSLGDRLVWAGWLPMCAAIGLLLVALGAGGWAVAGFLVLYNVLHLWLRVWGLRAGWRSGLNVAGALAAPWLQRALEVIAPLAGLAVGAALVSVLGWFPFRADWEMPVAVAAGVAVAAAVRVIQPRATGLVVAAAALALVVVAGALWP